MKSTQTRDGEPQWRARAARAGALEQSGAPAEVVQREDRPACHSWTDGAQQVLVRGAGGVGVW